MRQWNKFGRPRLWVPESALTRSGDETVGYVIEKGKVAKRVVITGPPTKEEVPVISGLAPNDFIIADTASLKVGDKVQAK